MNPSKHSITYRKEKDNNIEETNREVILLDNVHQKNVKAMDVSTLDKEQATELLNLLKEYKEYVDLKMKTLYSFEDWAELTKGKDISSQVKWRTFKIKNLFLND